MMNMAARRIRPQRCLRHWEEAVACLDRALTIDSRHAKARFNNALVVALAN